MRVSDGDIGGESCYGRGPTAKAKFFGIAHGDGDGDETPTAGKTPSFPTYRSRVLVEQHHVAMHDGVGRVSLRDLQGERGDGGRGGAVEGRRRELRRGGRR